MRAAELWEFPEDSMKYIDLRSDTVTQPSPAMWGAMQSSPLGDDVYGDDPTVAALESEIAQMLGFEAAMFVPTGTQGNLCALMSHCERGDEYIVGQMAHTYRWEAGGGAVLGSIQPQPLDNADDGSIPLDSIAKAIKADDPHFARTRLLCLENTIGGKILPADYVLQALRLAQHHGLSTHLDGARLFNAAVGSNLAPRDLCAGFDSVTVCFSKGLGTPAGSALCGSEKLIAKARRWRKMLGGGMRQSGVLAGAARYALKENIERLAQDHANARRLAEGLSGILGSEVRRPQTNIVFVDLPKNRSEALVPRLKEAGLLCTGLYSLRFVTHMNVTEQDVERALEIFEQVL